MPGPLRINVDNLSSSTFVGQNNANLDPHPHAQREKRGYQCSVKVDRDSLAFAGQRFSRPLSLDCDLEANSGLLRRLRARSTASALGLMLDCAHSDHDLKFAESVGSKAKQFYLNDKNCPLAYEPSGENLLSPHLGEADLMRRVLSSPGLGRWLRVFMRFTP